MNPLRRKYLEAVSLMLDKVIKGGKMYCGCFLQSQGACVLHVQQIKHNRNPLSMHSNHFIQHNENV